MKAGAGQGAPATEFDARRRHSTKQEKTACARKCDAPEFLVKEDGKRLLSVFLSYSVEIATIF